LRIESDGSAATLVLSPELDAGALTEEALTSFVQESGVVCGPALPAILEQAIASFRAAPARLEVVVAKKVPPKHGANGAIVWMPGFDPAAAAPAPAAQDVAAKIDHYNQSRYVTAAAGQHIATITPPSAGVDGYDVTNHPLKATHGSEYVLKTDESIAIDDQGRVSAVVNGVVKFANDSLKIMPMFEVPKSVDFSTGNIMFKGSVVVRGDVRDRFIVRATEDVTVSGLIEAATVICGRTLSVQCGMAAHDRGCLYVGGDAQVGYLKNVHGLVKGDLLVRREMINCEMAISRNLVCESGAVIGGVLCLSGSAIIGTLGSPNGTPTSIIFGSHPCQQQTADALQMHTSPAQTPAARKSSADNASAQLAKLTEQIRACAVQSGEFVVGSAKNADLTVTKMLHQGAVIRTGRCRVVIDRPVHGPIYIKGNPQAGLFYSTGDGVTHPLSDLAAPLERAG
jgi:uncharacterized protein (DUF342 family)